MDNQRKVDIDFVSRSLEKHPLLIKKGLSILHATEIAHIFYQLKEEDRTKLIDLFEIDIIAEIFPKLEEELRPTEIFQNFELKKQAQIIHRLEYDDAASLIADIPLENREILLNSLDYETARNLRMLLSYEESTAGRMMTTEVVRLNENYSKNEAMDEVIRQSEATHEVQRIYVVNDDNILKGFVTLRNLLVAQPTQSVKDIMSEEVRFVYPDTDQEDVAKTISKYDINTVAVVDQKMKLLGYITVDDVLDVIEQENTEDILRISGVSETEELGGTWQDGVKSRFPWLVVNILTAILASSVVRYFENTIASLVMLTAYMTIIAGMGGNAATQALAVTVRRLSLQEISKAQAYKQIKKEFLVGVINGSAVGLIVFVLSIVLDQNASLGLVIFLAMTCNLILASVTGVCVPLMLKKVNIDPAIASSIIITTFTDIFGFLLLLGLASIILL